MAQYFPDIAWFCGDPTSESLRLVGYLVVVADALESWHLPKTYGLALGAAVVPWHGLSTDADRPCRRFPSLSFQGLATLVSGTQVLGL